MILRAKHIEHKALNTQEEGTTTHNLNFPRELELLFLEA